MGQAAGTGQVGRKKEKVERVGLGLGTGTVGRWGS
jgi:hypothetical protein